MAALKQMDLKGKKVVCILSGGNMDVITMSSIVQHGLIQRDRIFSVSVLLPDKPGELVQVAKTIADNQGNVIKLEHNQFVSTNRNAAVELRITMEAFGTEHKNRILDALEKNGFRPKLISAKLKESRMGRKIPKKGDIYRHFKGKKYRILDLAVCTETGEDMVVFETVDGSHRMYASFLESFLSALDTGKYPHADQKYRFVLCRNDKQAQASSVKRHGNTTSLILEFLDLDENDQRIAFLQKHQAQIDSRFLTAAAESLEFTDDSETVEERYDALISFLKTKAKYENGRR